MWPEVEIYEARVPRAPRDLVLVAGTEPSMRWKRFTALVVELAEALGVQMVVTLGALLADVPHTRPVAITGLASDEKLVERLGLRASSYEGPTGIVGVLHSACAGAGMPSASLWAAVPHYVAAASNPKAALALVRKLEGLVGVSVDASEDNLFARAIRSEGEWFRVPGDSNKLPADFRATLEPTSPVVIVPLSARGQPIGLLVADNKFTLAPISDDDVGALMTFANTAAMAVDNASFESFFELFDDPNNRTLADNVGGTSITRSPAATSRWASSRPSPAADSIAHTRSEPNGSAQANNRSVWQRVAGNVNRATGCSSRSTATAVWVDL